jgi:hypothetical protein
MKLDAGEIKDLVTETEGKRADWAQAAEVWEKDWSLVRYEDTRETKREQDGVDVVVSPDPYMVVQLLHRFVADEMRVEIPSLSAKDDDEDRAEKIEEFLVAYEQQNNREQGLNLIHAKTWQSGVLGRGASQVLWVEPALEKLKLSGKRLPISKRKLDPRNVGIGRSVMGVEYAYHKYKTTRADIEARYPSFKLPEEHGNNIKQQGYYNERYTLIDWWCRHQGAIWHSVQIDDKFAKNPDVSDYPEIPIIEWYADGAPLDDELGRSLSILHPIHELWKMKCDLMSKIATGLMYHYDPAVVFKGFTVDQHIEFGPGANIYINENQSIDAFRPEPNVPMAQAMLQLIQTGIDQATFPGVTYGEGGGGQSGYAINSLSQAARSRANVIRSNIESAMELENMLVLGLIEEFAEEDGIEIYGRSGRSDRGKPIRLTAQDIKGNYDNRVTLIPEQPMDDNARVMAWMQMVEKGIASKSTMRNRVINISMPRDEELRIAAEQAEQSPEMQLKKQLRALQKTRAQDDWELLIQGTPLQQVHEQEQQWRQQKKDEAEQAKEQKRQEKREREQQELMANMPPLPPDMMMDPGMMGGSMPPSPPGGMTPPGGPMMPQPGMSPTGDASMQPQGIPGVPPAMAGQMTPDMLGIPDGAPPGMFDQMMGGQGPSEEELMRGMGGLPPQF